MSQQTKKSKEYKGFKSEAAYNSFLRSGLRRMWGRSYPPKNDFIKESRIRANIGRGGQEVWAAKCEICEGVFKQSATQVDHKIPAGSLIGDIEGFIDRLFCDKSNMRILCHKCHKTVTVAERNNCSFDEAKKIQQITEFGKKSVSEQKEFLLSVGFKEEDVANAVKRKNSITKHHNDN